MTFPTLLSLMASAFLFGAVAALVLSEAVEWVGRVRVQAKHRAMWREEAERVVADADGLHIEAPNDASAAVKLIKSTQRRAA